MHLLNKVDTNKDPRSSKLSSSAKKDRRKKKKRHNRSNERTPKTKVISVEKEKEDTNKSKLAILDKKFNLLFNREYQEDKKKLADLKEDIKREELKVAKHSDSDNLEKLGANLDISDVSSDNNQFSEDEDTGGLKPIIEDTNST